MRKPATIKRTATNSQNTSCERLLSPSATKFPTPAEKLLKAESNIADTLVITKV